jgi:hypothetical protein
MKTLRKCASLPGVDREGTLIRDNLPRSAGGSGNAFRRTKHTEATVHASAGSTTLSN